MARCVREPRRPVVSSNSGPSGLDGTSLDLRRRPKGSIEGRRKELFSQLTAKIPGLAASCGHCASRPLQRFHRSNVRVRSKTDPSDSAVCQCANGEAPIFNHDVERERRPFCKVSNQREVRKAWSEQTIGLCVSLSTLGCLRDKSIKSVPVWIQEKHIGPCVDEEASIGIIGHPADLPNAIDLIARCSQLSIAREAVFEVAPNGPRIDRPCDGLADRIRRITVAAFEVDSHRQLRHRNYAAQILEGSFERHSLTIREAVCVSDRPAARRDRPRAGPRDRDGATGIPDVEQHHRFARNVQRAKLLRLAPLLHPLPLPEHPPIETPRTASPAARSYCAADQ